MKTINLLAIMAVLVAIVSAANVFIVMHGSRLSQGTGSLWYVTLSYLVALAVETDRKSRKLSAPYEHGAWVFFAWPIVVPYYLYTVHGWRGVALGIGFFLFSSIPDIAGIVTYLYIQE